MDLISVDPQLNLYDADWPIRTYQPNLPPPKFVFAEKGQSARCGQALDSIVCQGCIVSGGQLERTILGPDSRINSYAHVEDSILFEGVNVGRHAKIRRAIIDKGFSSRRHRDRLRPRPGPQPRLHRHRTRRHGDRQDPRRGALPGEGPRRRAEPRRRSYVPFRRADRLVLQPCCVDTLGAAGSLPASANRGGQATPGTRHFNSAAALGPYLPMA